jgi:hypothetical protein
MAYNKERDAVSDAQWQAQFDEGKRQYEQGRADSLAAAAAKGSGTGTPKAQTYTKLTAEESNKWEKKFGSQTTVKGIEFQADAMEASGFDPETVAAWADYYKGLLIGEQPPVEPPNVPNQGSAGGGGGGGRNYYAVR